MLRSKLAVEGKFRRCCSDEGQTKETKFERRASPRQLFMLWSHNVGEAKYERCVTCLDLVLSGLSLFSFFLHATCSGK